MQQKLNEAKKYTLKKARGNICLQIVYNVKSIAVYECAEIYANGEISRVEPRSSDYLFHIRCNLYILVLYGQNGAPLTIKCTTW